MRDLTLACAALVFAASTLAPVQAEPTDVTVRVISKGAKFVGTSMGGVLVTLHDVHTGELLAKGHTAGGTGDTARIMTQAHQRGAALSTPDAARFEVTLDLDEPRLVEARAQGPMGQPQSANRVSATQWLVPGRDVTGGDAWLLEMPGLVVDVLAPAAHTRIGSSAGEVRLHANVTMMCGCPIAPGGLWDADEIEVRALLQRNGEPAGEVKLSYAGSTSQFEGRVRVDEPGVYKATVFAHQPANGNTGLDRVTFIVAP